MTQQLQQDASIPTRKSIQADLLKTLNILKDNVRVIRQGNKKTIFKITKTATESVYDLMVNS